jgi:hypothetical protein
MAPSATHQTSTVVTDLKKDVPVSKQPEVHVHGGEDKTPLEAISHGPIIMEGKSIFFSRHEIPML